MKLTRIIPASAFVLLLSLGCGSDDTTSPENNDPGDAGPAGTWDVAWSNMIQDCPTEALIDALIEAALGLEIPTNNQWQIAAQSASALELKQAPACIASVVNYDPTTRRLNEDLAQSDVIIPKSVIDEVCAVIECPPEVELYSEFLKEVRISPRREPDLIWTENFATFSGTYTLAGEVTAIADAPIIGEIEIPLGNCSVSWTLNGVRCESCSPCP